MGIALRSVAQLTENDRAALGVLSAAVYSADVVAFVQDGPSNGLCAGGASCWDHDATQALAHAGIVVRQARYNECDVKIGGVGGVMTHPAFRRQGYAAAAIERC